MQFSVSVICLALFVALVGIATHHLNDISDETNSVSPSKVHVDLVKPESAIKHLAEILKFKTISSHTAENHVESPKEFQGLHQTLRKQWPSVFKALRVDVVRSPSSTIPAAGLDLQPWELCQSPAKCILQLQVS